MFKKGEKHLLSLSYTGVEMLTGQGDQSATCVTHPSMPSLKREQVTYNFSLGLVLYLLHIDCLII